MYVSLTYVHLQRDTHIYITLRELAIKTHLEACDYTFRLLLLSTLMIFMIMMIYNFLHIYQ